MAEEAKWYVAHTYSGYENKVKTTIEKTVENQKLQDQIQEVMVPMQTVMEVKNDKKREVQRKLYPGYVLVKMIMNDDTWYVVRNTRGVTGFVGPGSKPVPLTETEMRNMGIQQSRRVSLDVSVGDSIRVISGPWADTESVVKTVNEQKEKVTIDVDVFGRESSVEIDFSDIQKL
ncbi:MAG: transcription termination/antitermination protein NusG [Lachnospiraceae bacterium]|mgnify:CR=1 FL=1|nr:transcription termination/antitermination protein NusG [Lachnospiraceae bacterium]